MFWFIYLAYIHSPYIAFHDFFFFEILHTVLRCCSQFAHFSVIQTQTTHLFQRLQGWFWYFPWFGDPGSFSGSTRMMSASTWSVHGSGPKNMPCDSHPFQTSCNIMIINHSVQALFKPNPNCKTRFDPFPFCWVNKWPWPKNHKVILPMWGDKILDLRFLYAVHLCAPNPRDLASNVVVVLSQTVDQWLVL